MSLRVARLALVWTLIVATATVFSQRPDLPAFEVASVRLAPGPGLTSQRMTDTRVDLAFMSLRALLLLAFRAKAYELAAPEWLAETRVSIQATLPAGATRQQIPEMLQRLLVERFHLAVHREPRPMDVYELVVGPGGHKMREVEPADELDKSFPVNQIAKQSGTLAQMDTVVDTPDGPVRTVTNADDVSRTTVTARTSYKLTWNTDRLGRRTQSLDASRMTMTELATVLTNVTGQPVLDRTGLRGFYQFNNVELPLDAWVLEAARTSAQRLGRTFEAPNLSAPKAVESLGLKLERRRSPVEVVVIDSIDRTPTDN